MSSSDDDNFLEEKLKQHEIEAVMVAFIAIDKVVDRDTMSKFMVHLWHELYDILDYNRIDGNRLWMTKEGEIRYESQP